ncbi:PP_RS20740 family protein [Vreelandella neptunia]|uniref:PP_RS20740 family protein n=1 Tax=Vreelandella neptunia TaxID=115551 RepID=UPI003159D526
MDEFANAEVFGIVDEQTTPKDTHFDAWHRPRKHWIRSKQWWNALDELRKDRSHLYSNSFNILTLPGGELLDIRYFYQQLRKNKSSTANVERLRLTGFVNNLADYERAQRNLPLLGISDTSTGDSVIKHDNIDNLSRDGVLKKTFEDMGPFELINLDYCNSIAPSGNNNRIESIYKIVTHQCQHQSKPWLLMFTTRTTKGSVSNTFFSSAEELISNLLIESEDFLESFSNHYSDCLEITQQNLFHEAAKLKLKEEYSSQFSEIFVVGLLAWLLSTAREHGVKVKLTSVVRYDVEGDKAESDMFSLVLRFEKIGRINADPTGIANVENSDFGLENRGKIASRVVSKVKKAKAVESILFSNPEIYREISQDLSIFLEECGKCMTTFWEEVCREEVEKNGWTLEQVKRK